MPWWSYKRQPLYFILDQFFFIRVKIFLSIVYIIPQNNQITIKRLKLSNFLFESERKFNANWGNALMLQTELKL